MRLALARTIVLGFWLLIATETQADIALSKAYQMKGICKIKGDWMVSLFNTESGNRFWLRTGQSIGALQLTTFDDKTYTAHLSYNDEEFALMFDRPENRPQAVLLSIPQRHDQVAQIEEEVNAHREGLKRILVEPISGPRTSKAQAKLEKDLANMVTNYREQLIADLSRQESNPEATILLSSSEPRHGTVGIKRRNRVNSRIWASDHIEKHGMPEQE